MAVSGVSIVVVNWNTRELLLALLARIHRARVTRPVQVVVVDNASADGSVAAVRAAWPEVVVLPQAHNLGFGKGVNRGVAAARHEFVLLLNTDVEFEADAIERLAAWADAHPAAAIVGPRIVDAAGRVQRSCWSVPTLVSMFAETFALHRLVRPVPAPGSPRRVDCVSGCVFLVRRAVFAELGGFDEEFFMYFEETDLCRRAGAAGLEVWYAPDAGDFVHEGGGSGHGVRRALKRTYRRSEVLFHEKRAGRLAGAAAHALARCAVALRIAARGLMAAR